MSHKFDKNRSSKMMRQSNFMLNEHWKRKHRLKEGIDKSRGPAGGLLLSSAKQGRQLRPTLEPRMVLADNQTGERSAHVASLMKHQTRNRKTSMIDIFRSPMDATMMQCLSLNPPDTTTASDAVSSERFNCDRGLDLEPSNANFATTTSYCRLLAAAPADEVTGLNGNGNCHRKKIHTPHNQRPPPVTASIPLITFTPAAAAASIPLIILLAFVSGASSQSLLQSDPRPTIYSGQVSFGLLLSAHSSLGAELSTSASHQVVSMLRVEPPDNFTENSVSDTTVPMATLSPAPNPTPTTTTSANRLSGSSATTETVTGPITSFTQEAANFPILLEPQYQLMSDSILEELVEGQESRVESLWGNGKSKHSIDKRQIFERTGQHRRQHHHHQLQTAHLQTNSANNKPPSAVPAQSSSGNQLAPTDSGICTQVNANALYAGMGAIWASHQANLVGDSHLAIGTYVYDSCNDLDVGQRQSVRIVSNLNAFQQTTCESPRGSPISLTIAHGDNQLRAIQLLTSFKVPVITTKEHFALEDYNQLTRDQKRFLFTTAPSSRHLAVGALRFSKRIVSRSVSSPKLPNQFYKMSSKNGLIVISRNLPARFIAYLTEMIPKHVNYEMLQSNQPIDQIRSVEALESILIKSSTSESKLSLTKASPPPTLTSGFGGHSNVVPPGAKSSNINLNKNRRNKRSDDSDSSNLDNMNSEFDPPSSSDDPDNAKMLSPTILMFITPSEAIDLVTRLRNDLAEVSRYYSLIVTTREDISPALKTIFHRGGSRLCSGKAFYTISPKPDDIGEFSRYFRDTVQMEGESSDHPLVCEFAKYQANSKINADLDDISTEPVIKAVWSAAAAFKSVHRRECAHLAATPLATSSGSEIPSSAGPTSASGTAARNLSSRQSSKSAHAECLVKMNKNMSNLVQRALKRLDVTINSTGLQSLDGFQLKFDEFNELQTNRFSIKYINKECEITEIGQYSGFKESSLRIDEETLVKSLEGSMPDPWPVQAKPLAPQPQASATNKPAPSRDSPAKEASSSEDTSADSAGPSDSPASSKSGRKGKRGGGGFSALGESNSSPEESSKPSTEEEDTTPTIAGDSSEISPIESPKRNRKRSKPSEEKQSKRKLADGAKKKQLIAAPVTALGGKNILPGVTDTEMTSDPRSVRALPNPPINGSSNSLSDTTPTTTTAASSTLKPMRKLKPFPSSVGTTFKDWLPIGEALTTANTKLDSQTTTRTPKLMVDPESALTTIKTNQVDNNSDDYLDDLLARPTTQSPVESTLPESDGNADLETMPAKVSRVTKSASAFKLGRALQTAASTTRENADYVTAPSISKNLYNKQPTLTSRQPYPLTYQSVNGMEQPIRSPLNITAADGDLPIVVDRNNDYLRDLNASPVPLSAHTSRLAHLEHDHETLASSTDGPEAQSAEPKGGRFRIRSHMRWIYSSWYALSILGANICGALLTLYVLTFLLMRNCDGSLDRDNQGIRSMHLLAVIVVFFGSTLFIVYPTPGLCLLRTSWHNFALVMLFGSLLLQAMQTRSLQSLGLGGRPNRLNQFLTLIFMVGVQVAFEFQRWKYESANYMNFVNQYFGGQSSASHSGKKFMILNGAISDHFNPLNSFNDQVTPVNIQIGEHYQNLLQDYCLQQVDDFLQSQVYLFLIIGLLISFSVSNRRRRRLAGSSTPTNHHHKLKSTLTSGKLVACQHEANLDLSPSHFQFASQSAGSHANTGNIFTVTIISALAYSISVVLHVFGQNTANRDLISSVTMVLIAFTALIGIFLPILLQIHRYDSVLASNHLAGSLSRPVVTQSKLQDAHNSPSSPTTSAFTMFPEFAPTGLRRPASTSGDSSSGAGSRCTFADTKESRRNMGAALANLGPSADSLRSMGFYTTTERNNRADNNLEPSLLKLKLNLSAIDEPSSTLADKDYGICNNTNNQQQHHFHHQHQMISSRKQSNGEKRLIMLDVDPCCPRHGVGAWPKIDEHGSLEGAKPSKTSKFNK